MSAIVKISTSLGDMKVRLYDETPKHRDNFLKLANEGFYNGLLFHRIIKGFMIQGGDPESKTAPKGKSLGAGDVGYTIDAEFVYPQLFHKKGALAAARTGDEVNPEKKSSGCQFYIVQGKKYSDSELNQMEKQMLMQAKEKRFNAMARENADEVMRLRLARDQKGLMALQTKLIDELEKEFKGKKVTFTDEQREAYKTVGGTPFLDNDYTVFGEVIEGLEIIDEIAKVKTDRGDRPEDDLKMTVTVE